MKTEGLLHKVLLSHDAGWYTAGEAGGGSFRPYTDMSIHLLPALREKGFTEEDFDQMLKVNPASAYRMREIAD